MTSDDQTYTCPMHAEVRQRGPGNCPKCGMALEPVLESAPRTEWTCPMHPQVVRDAPGACPICGMALEPRGVPSGEEESHELKDMSRRLWVAGSLSAVLVAVAMGHLIPGDPLSRALSMRGRTLG